MDSDPQINMNPDTDPESPKQVDPCGSGSSPLNNPMHGKMNKDGNHKKNTLNFS